MYDVRNDENEISIFQRSCCNKKSKYKILYNTTAYQYHILYDKDLLKQPLLNIFIKYYIAARKLKLKYGTYLQGMAELLQKFLKRRSLSKF